MTFRLLPTLELWNPETGEKAVINAPNMLLTIISDEEIANRRTFEVLIGKGFRVIKQNSAGTGERPVILLVGEVDRPAGVRFDRSKVIDSSPDGLRFLTADEDGQGRIWNAEGALLRTLPALELASVQEFLQAQAQDREEGAQDDLEDAIEVQPEDDPDSLAAPALEAIEGLEGPALLQPVDLPLPAAEVESLAPAAPEVEAPSALILPQGDRIVVPEIKPAAPISNRKRRG
jgi:hypothetical protein